MGEWRDIYAVAGGDPEKALARLGGNEEMLKRFLRLFAGDGSFADLRAALAADKTEDAFRAAHTLKGICANLGLDGLYARASEITELLRRGELDGARTLFPGLAEMYGNVMEKMERLL